MFAGHLAAGLALKKVNRRISLGWLFFAAMFHDFLLGILVLLGIELVHVPVNFEELHYLTFTFPYSHGFAASVFWSLVGFGITYVVLSRWSQQERVSSAAAIGIAVFSHFVLDWPVHVPEIPLFGESSAKLGLGLWNNPPLALTLEVGLVILGFFLYLRAVKPKAQWSVYALGILMLFVSVMTVVGMVAATTPPPASGAAMSWIVMPLILSPLAYWFDRS